MYFLLYNNNNNNFFIFTLAQLTIKILHVQVFRADERDSCSNKTLHKSLLGHGLGSFARGREFERPLVLNTYVSHKLFLLRRSKYLFHYRRVKSVRFHFVNYGRCFFNLKQKKDIN